MKKILLPVFLLLFAMSDALAGDVVVIGNANLGKLDVAMVQKIFTGKLIKVDGIDVTAVNIKSGPLRDQFLQTFLQQTDAKYTAYWAIRLFVGKGAPPPELSSPAEVVKFVQSTPGAIGYVDESDLVDSVRVLAR
jgi:ABC-type phosphate transport system substrate-binding protein